MEMQNKWETMSSTNYLDTDTTESIEHRIGINTMLYKPEIIARGKHNAMNK